MSNLKAKLRDAKWLEKEKEKDPLLTRRKDYFLSGTAIKKGIKCNYEDCVYKLGNDLDGSLSSAFQGMSMVSTKNYPMMFCFSCNRTYHCACIGITAENLKIEPVPWICRNCVCNEDNEVAKAYFLSDQWKAGLKDRKKQFLCAESVARKPALLEVDSTDEELDPTDESSLQTSLNHSAVPERSFGEIGTVPVTTLIQQQKEMRELLDLYKKAESDRSKLAEENATMQIQMDEMKREMDEIKKKFKDSNGGAKPKVRINEQSQIIPSTVFSSTCVAHVLTVKEMLAETYLTNPKMVEKEHAESTGVQDDSYNNSETRIVGDEANNGEENDMSRTSVGNLSFAERIILEQTKAQQEATKAQKEAIHSKNLKEVRHALPKIKRFSGDVKDWIRFKRDVERYITVGEYDDYMMRLFIMDALDGLALERVRDFIDKYPVNKTMKILEEGFGCPDRIIEKCGQDILNLRLDKHLFRDDVMRINAKIQAYFAACQYAGTDYANTNFLAKHIFDQFNPQNKQFFRNHFRSANEGEANKLMDLESIFSFLEELAPVLEDKKATERKEEKARTKAIMVTTIGNNHAVNRGSDDYMYEIRGNDIAIYQGYDMNAVNEIPKHCEICSKNHYTVQCRNYRTMDNAAKLRLVAEKGLCKNCMLATTHRAINCAVKTGCGYKMGKSRCSQKHHISLHNALANVVGRFSQRGSKGNSNRFGRRNNTNANTNKARDIVKDSQGQQNESNNSSQLQSQQPTAPPAEPSQAPSINQLPNRQNGGNASTSTGRFTGSVSSSKVPVNYNVLPYDKGNQMQNVMMCGVQRTVKVFKNKFLGNHGYVVGYSVGDSAAEVTLVREDLRQALKIEGEPCTLELQWTDNSRKVVNAIKIDLKLQGVMKNAEKLTLRNCYAVEDLNLPERSLDMKSLKRQFPYLRNVKFESYHNVSPCLLIGSPHASVIESVGKLYEDGEGKPVGLLAKLGWCVYGGCPDEYESIPKSIQAIAQGNQMVPYKQEIKESISNEELYDLFAFFSSVESLGISGKSSHTTEEEQKALDIVREEMTVLEDGSIELPLAWNRDENMIPSLPDNFPMTLKRQLAHESKLNKDPAHLTAYNECFKEFIREGYVRPATNDDIYGNWMNVWYLPMTLVVNANKDPVKYRIVFDASARYNGTSLNENLLKGPDLMVDLIQPLLRMRENRIAFTADIKSMFMRMKINVRDQQCQRVIWREDKNDDFRVYIVSSVLFGPTCSPFESQLVKNETAEKWKGKYPEAADTIQHFMYMDDLLSSEPNVSKAIEVAKQCIDIFQTINWNLVAFQSNSLRFMKALPEANVKQELIPLMENENAVCTTKVLGCMWDPKSDCYVFKFDKNLFIKIVKELNHRPTKRDQSSTIARIYDVLGLIAPFVIRGKILYQRSWYEKLGWDEEISEIEHKNWLNWLTDIENVAKLKIPRMYANIDSLSHAESIELHTFCDSGDEAFAAVSYIVVCNKGIRESNIVMAKARVAPLRLKSGTKICEMPRLELYAAMIGARLTDTITKCYEGIKFERHLWSDSEVVLRWLLNPNHRLLKYAIAPVEEILEKTERKEWHYVPTKVNVADIATKFKKFDFSDSMSVWFTGPSFLRMGKQHWPTMPNLNGMKDPEKVMVNAINMKDVFSFSSQRLPHIDCPFAKDCLIDTFSSSIQGTWIKLVRATARALKLFLDGFIPLIKSKKYRDKKALAAIKALHNNFETLETNDYERAELFLIRKTQRENMPEIYKRLMNNQVIVDEELSQLNVFMDNEGIIRINSRVELDTAVYPQRFAPFLPRKTALTRILLFHFHVEYKHVCLEAQIAAVRAKVWIPQLRTALKSVQANCNLCNLKRAKPYAPLMAPLPRFRVDPAQQPFEVTGVDCAGPIKVTLHTTPKEIHVLIFTCTLTRFVHLHILDSLHTTKVLEAIAMFWSSHGPVRTFLSDNGRNFTGAGKFLKEQSNILGEQLAEKYGCDWKFIPAHSPWFGGVYERLIKEVKRAIQHILEKRVIQKIELNIALHDSAHRLNNRPLTHNSIAAEDGLILTPHMLAKGRSGWPLLPGLRTCLPVPDHKKDRDVYRRGRSIADAIMRKFVSGYLPELTKRSKWLQDKEPMKVGDLVLIIEPNQTRKEWTRGRVTRLYKSRDRRSRVADVMRHDGVLKIARSIQRLAKIKISQFEDA